MLNAAGPIRASRTLAWTWILLAASGAAALTFVFINAVVYAFSYAGAKRGLLEAVAGLAGGPLAGVAFAVLVFYAGSRVATGVGERPLPHALCVGVGAAILLQAVFLLLAPPVYLSETLIYLLLGTAAGYAAARYARRTLAARLGYTFSYRACRSRTALTPVTLEKQHHNGAREQEIVLAGGITELLEEKPCLGERPAFLQAKNAATVQVYKVGGVEQEAVEYVECIVPAS